MGWATRLSSRSSVFDSELSDYFFDVLYLQSSAIMRRVFLLKESDLIVLLFEKEFERESDTRRPRRVGDLSLVLHYRWSLLVALWFPRHVSFTWRCWEDVHLLMLLLICAVIPLSGVCVCFIVPKGLCLVWDCWIEIDVVRWN